MVVNDSSAVPPALRFVSQTIIAICLTTLVSGAGPTSDTAPPTVFPPRDFVEYWSAARVYARGGDPYDGVQLLPYQREASGDPELTEATMLWTPPWTLPLYLPFGYFDPRTAHLLWLAVQTVCVLISAWLLWRVFAGSASGVGRVIPFLAAVLFAPVGSMVWYGQNTGFILLGVAGFLYLRTRDRPTMAGAVVTLTAIKPHLLALFGLALLLDAGTRSGRRVLIGGLTVLVMAAGMALLPAPGVFQDFIDALRRPQTAEMVPLSHWSVPTLGFQLRKFVAEERFASDPGALFGVQFLPLLVGVSLLGPYWYARRHHWDWVVETPRLVFASVLVAPYGAWLFDLTVLLVPILAAYARLARSPRLVPAIIVVGSFLLPSAFTVIPPDQYQEWFGSPPFLHHFVWYAPAYLFWCGLVALLARPAVTVQSRPNLGEQPA